MRLSSPNQEVASLSQETPGPTPTVKAYTECRRGGVAVDPLLALVVWFCCGPVVSFCHDLGQVQLQPLVNKMPATSLAKLYCLSWPPVGVPTHLILKPSTYTRSTSFIIAVISASSQSSNSPQSTLLESLK